MELNPVDILISVINIAVLSVLLRLILWKPVIRFLTARSERVRSELEETEKALEDARSLKQEYADNIRGVEARGREMMRQSQIRASEEAATIIGEAHEKSEKLLLEAHERIADERERAYLSSRHEIAQLAADMASSILRREVSKNDSEKAVEDFFREER